MLRSSSVLLVALSAATVRADADGDHLRRLDQLFGTSGASPSAQGEGRAAREKRLRDFVRDRLGQSAFYDAVLPRLFPLLALQSYPMPSVLVHEGEGASEYYYLAIDGPCAKNDRVSVRPWWDLEHPVSVCRASYRPEIKSDRSGGTEQFCEATYFNFLSPMPQCRCGEHLMNCSRDAEQAAQHRHSYMEEPVRLMQRVIQRHLPFREVLTTTETVYSDLAGLYYARDRFLHGGPFELVRPDASRGPSVHERPALYAGGILTTPPVVYWDPSRRLTISNIWEAFLCVPNASTAVRAKDILNVSSGTLREKGHAQLAKMLGCRDCHAKLENALPALSSFSLPSNGMRTLPLDGPPPLVGFYVRDSTDLRGEGPATAGWIGEMIASQPEFAPCVVRKIEDLVYGGFPVPPEVDATLLARFAEGQDFARILEDALVAQHLGTSTGR